MIIAPTNTGKMHAKKRKHLTKSRTVQIFGRGGNSFVFIKQENTMATLQIQPKIAATNQLSTLELKGDFTAMDAMDSRSEIIDFISGNNGEVVIDLRSVEVIDLAGINILAMAQRSAEANQKELQIKITTNGNIIEWIRMTKMDRLLNIQTVN